MADLRISTQSGRFNEVIGHLSGLPQRLHSTLIQATGEATSILQRSVVAQINRRTGQTGASVRASVRPTTRGAHGEVYSDSPVMRYLEEGTGLYGPEARKYPIEPTTAKALRFEYQGRVQFAKRVMHPGIRAQHPMERGSELAAPEIGRLYDERIRREL